MMTVRFPDGTAVQYNTGLKLKYGDGAWGIYSDSACTMWVASIQLSAGAIIEATPACRVYNPTRSQSLRELVDAVLAHRGPNYHEACELKRLKQELQKFNSRGMCWKP